MLHVYMLDCAARLVMAQDVATSAFALRIKRGFCCRLLPLILLPLGSYQPFNLRIGSGAFGLMASGDASSSAAPGERGAASPTVATEAAPQTVRPPRAEEVPVPETPQGTTRREKNNRRRRERREEERAERDAQSPTAAKAPAPKREPRPLPKPRNAAPPQGMQGKGKGPVGFPTQPFGKGSGSRPASDPGTGSMASQWNMVNPMMAQSGMYGKGSAAPSPMSHPMTSSMSMGWYWSDGYNWYHTLPARVPAQSTEPGSTAPAAASGASQPNVPGRAQAPKASAPAPKRSVKPRPAPGRTSGPWR
jgi:hypothetical protein